MKFYDVRTHAKMEIEFDRLNQRVCIMSHEWGKWLGFGAKCYPSNILALTEAETYIRRFPEPYVMGVLMPNDVYILTNKLYIVLEPGVVRHYRTWLSMVYAREVDELGRAIVVRGPYTRIPGHDLDVVVGYGYAYESTAEVELTYIIPLSEAGKLYDAIDKIVNLGVATAEDAAMLKKTLSRYRAEIEEMKRLTEELRKRLRGA